MEEKKLTLSEKLSAITEEVGPITKTKRPGDTVSFKYRSIDDVQNHLNPLFAKYGITTASKILHHNLTCREFEKNGNKRIAYTADVILQVSFSDGKDIESWEEWAMSEDYADKAVTQAMSMAYKYALLRKFCITTEDISDGDSRQPDYRDTSHDEMSGPRPTEWLNENTPEWDIVEAKLRSGEWNLADVRSKWKVNKRQDPVLAAMYKVPAKNTEQTNPTKAAAPASKGKVSLSAELKERIDSVTHRLGNDAAAILTELKSDKDGLAYYNSVVKLLDGKVSLAMVRSVYQLDATVDKYFESIAKKKE